MAFGFLKSTQSSGASVTTLAITVPAVPVGALVIVNVKFTVAVVLPSVTDNASTPNTYAAAIGPITSGTNIMYQFYGVAITGGVTTVTINWTNSVSVRATVEQFSGGKQTNATVFDVAASNIGTGTSASLTLTPSASGGLISACIGLNAGASAVVKGANYVIGTNNASTSTEYRIPGTTSETAPISWTTSVLWAEIAGSYVAQPNYGHFMEFM